MKTVLSGIQPTGNIHIGNYLGSIKNWIELQDNHECIFGIMNLHALTQKQDPNELKNSIFETVAIYLACGIDHKKSILFLQSDVSAHAELAWIFSTITSLGWLNRMTQFKEKSAKNENLGLYAYPVLMAADILLYKADLVPVGEDQKQHLELTRDIVLTFNNRYSCEYFKLPEPLIFEKVKRIMSLQDGTKKMSKSDEAVLSRINLSDSIDEIVKKIKKSKTDSFDYIEYDKSRPEIYNLLNIFAAFSKEEPQDIALKYKSSGFGKFKSDLAEIVVENIKPIHDNLSHLKDDKVFIEGILKEGKEKSSLIASKNLAEIYEIIGIK